ncbi:MAG TPA: type II toxin-antitoxin system VapC family toxin [Candidatus Saccharimonadales bacterium]|jgi:predicted nucleic acid-binding protein|nr:type II toxin-antitoxin system VapC family toxin [Candidatus Saccharimonadales bacterium]
MSFLLDTNVISEWMKPRPNPGLVAWFAKVEEDRVFISVVTLTEVRYGIERMAVGNKRKGLEHWLQNELPIRFDGRILPVDVAVADASGRVAARSEHAGRPIEAIDAFIAATAEVHRLTLVTRNQSDFQAVLNATLNPWT